MTSCRPGSIVRPSSCSSAAPFHSWRSTTIGLGGATVGTSVGTGVGRLVGSAVDGGGGAVVGAAVAGDGRSGAPEGGVGNGAGPLQAVRKPASPATSARRVSRGV